MKKTSKKIQKTDKIDDLAIMVKHGFDRVDEKFEKLEKKVDKIGGTVDSLEVKVDQLEVKVDRIENLILGRYDRRLDVIEDRLRQIVTVLNIK